MRPRIRQYHALIKLPPDVMLAGMDLAIGLIYLLQGPSRTSVALKVAVSLLPLWVWGLYFALIGVLLVIPTLRPRFRPPFIWLFHVMAPALFVMWALMFLIAGTQDDRVSFAGVPLYLYLGYRHSLSPVTR